MKQNSSKNINDRTLDQQIDLLQDQKMRLVSNGRDAAELSHFKWECLACISIEIPALLNYSHALACLEYATEYLLTIGPESYAGVQAGVLQDPCVDLGVTVPNNELTYKDMDTINHYYETLLARRNMRYIT